MARAGNGLRTACGLSPTHWRCPGLSLYRGTATRAHHTMSDTNDDPGPEDPTRFPSEPHVEPLDESPDGTTPSDADEPSPESLPPGAE